MGSRVLAEFQNLSQAMFLFTSPEGDIGTGTLKRIQSEFSELLGEQASVEEYAEWIKELIDKLVVKVCEF